VLIFSLASVVAEFIASSEFWQNNIRKKYMGPMLPLGKQNWQLIHTN
jgi:hypothetical protein